VEWRHHQKLAAEARENIANELRDNKGELDGLLKNAPETTKHYTDALKLFRDRLAGRKITKHQMTLAWNVVTLNDSSWTTAQTVGALSYMGYAEVKRYAPIYGLQAEFLRLQQRTLDTATSSLSAVASGEDPEIMPETDMRSEIAKLEGALAAMTAEPRSERASEAVCRGPSQSQRIGFRMC
jgi:hypothetical protein